MNRQGSNLIHMTVRNLTFGFLLCTLLLTGTKTFAGPDDDAYFEQLHFQKITDASDPDFPNITYHWLMAGFPFLLNLTRPKTYSLIFPYFCMIAVLLTFCTKTMSRIRGPLISFPAPVTKFRAHGQFRTK
jgi:hypothetical protein